MEMPQRPGQVRVHLPEAEAGSLPSTGPNPIHYFQASRGGDLLATGADDPYYQYEYAITRTPSLTDCRATTANHHCLTPVDRRSRWARPGTLITSSGEAVSYSGHDRPGVKAERQGWPVTVAVVEKPSRDPTSSYVIARLDPGGFSLRQTG